MECALEELENWPRLVQIAWLLCDEDGKELKRGNKIIYPVDFDIPEEASDIHGITLEKARDSGEFIEDVIPEFIDDLSNLKL